MPFRAGSILLAVLLTGCATGPPPGGHMAMEGLRYRPSTPAEHPEALASRKRARQAHRGGSSGPSALVARSVMGGMVQVDAFEQVLLYAGLDTSDELPPREAPLTPEDAAALYDVLLDKPVTLPGFGPRLVTTQVLLEILEGEEELPRFELLQRMERFQRLVVLRPDGYLSWALSGKTQQRVGPVQWRDGAFRAGLFEVGRFYSGRSGMAFFPVDDRLQEVRTLHPLAEVYDDADVISRVLDGAEESFVELGVALGYMVVHPIDSLSGLSQLPEGLALLIASSPGYLQRFRLMTRGEQIHALSKLATTLLATYGAAASTTRTIAATGRGLETVSLPALSLTAEGRWRWSASRYLWGASSPRSAEDRGPPSSSSARIRLREAHSPPPRRDLDSGARLASP